MIRSRGVNEAGRLLAEDGLLKMTVKKSVLHVELVNGPRLRGSNAEDDANRGRFDNWTESLVVVDAVLLGEAPHNPTCLMPSKGSISIIFMLENPLAGDDIGTGWSRNQAPCTIVDESLKLLRHSRAPLRVSQRTAIVSW
jgi:hypothetical protein